MRIRKGSWSTFKRLPAVFVGSTFVLWWLFVGLSGQTWWPAIKTHWDFSATGQLGDSFGILSAFMASMAAIFTYQTLADTRRQADIAEREAERQKKHADEAREEARVERDRSEARAFARDFAESRRDSEGTYFRLLDLRFRVLADLRTEFSSKTLEGTDAAASYIRVVTSSSGIEVSHTKFPERYSAMYQKYNNDLGHYFRFTYHIVKFAKENFGRDAYDCIRLLRAQLSNAEMALLALNCAHGEGKKSSCHGLNVILFSIA